MLSLSRSPLVPTLLFLLPPVATAVVLLLPFTLWSPYNVTLHLLLSLPLLALSLLSALLSPLLFSPTNSLFTAAAAAAGVGGGGGTNAALLLLLLSPLPLAAAAPCLVRALAAALGLTQAQAGWEVVVAARSSRGPRGPGLAVSSTEAAAGGGGQGRVRVRDNGTAECGDCKHDNDDGDCNNNDAAGVESDNSEKQELLGTHGAHGHSCAHGHSHSCSNSQHSHTPSALTGSPQSHTAGSRTPEAPGTEALPPRVNPLSSDPSLLHTVTAVAEALAGVMPLGLMLPNAGAALVAPLRRIRAMAAR